jgi:hypothetical protein
MNTVLGYGKIGEYSGESWELNAISNALARGLITGDADLSAPATREEVIQYVFNTIKPDPTGNAKNYMVEYSDLVHAYIPSGTNAFQGAQQVNLDAYLGARVFGLVADPDIDDFGIDWRTWRQNGKLLVGEEKYPAGTLIADFVTDKAWTGRDLARAYEWDDLNDGNDSIEIWYNGYSGNAASPGHSANEDTYAIATSIHRSNTDNVIPGSGYRIRLYDDLGESYTIGTNTVRYVDNGKVGKVVVTSEYLGQITKVNANAGVVDVDLFDIVDTATSAPATWKSTKVAFANVITDNTFAVKDFVSVIPQNVSYDLYYSSGYATNALNPLQGTSEILSIEKAETAQVRASSYTRNVPIMLTGSPASGTVRLATITSGDASYLVASHYAYGIGEVPSFEGDALLYLDSNGSVIGISGELASAGTYKYVYVDALMLSTSWATGSAPRLQAQVIYADTYTKAIVDIPIKHRNNVYYATINNADAEISFAYAGDGSITAATIGGISGTIYGSNALTFGAPLVGWYWYTSDKDASTITLRSNAYVANTTTPLPRSIVTDPVTLEGTPQTITKYGTFGVGTLIAPAMAGVPRGINGGVVVPVAAAYGDIRSDSKTVMYYNGTKYTGYSTFPSSLTAYSAENKALAIRGSQGVIEAFYVIFTHHHHIIVGTKS